MRFRRAFAVLFGFLALLIAGQAYAQERMPVEGADYKIVRGPNARSTYIKIMTGVNVYLPVSAEWYGTNVLALRRDNQTKTLAMCRMPSGRFATSDGIDSPEKRVAEDVWHVRDGGRVRDVCPKERRYVYFLPGETIESTSRHYLSPEEEHEAVEAIKGCNSDPACLGRHLSPLGVTFEVNAAPKPDKAAEEAAKKQAEELKEAKACLENADCLKRKLDELPKPAQATLWNKLSIGLAVVGGALLIATIVFGVLWWKRRADKKKLEAEVEKLKGDLEEFEAAAKAKGAPPDGQKVIVTTPTSEHLIRAEAAERHLRENIEATKKSRELLLQACVGLDVRLPENPSLDVIVEKYVERVAALRAASVPPPSADKRSLEAVKQMLIVEAVSLGCCDRPTAEGQTETQLTQLIVKRIQGEKGRADRLQSEIVAGSTKHAAALPHRTALLGLVEANAPEGGLDPEAPLEARAAAVIRSLVAEASEQRSDLHTIRNAIVSRAGSLGLKEREGGNEPLVLELFGSLLEAYDNKHEELDRLNADIKRCAELYQAFAVWNPKLFELLREEQRLMATSPTDPRLTEIADERAQILEHAVPASREFNEVHTRLTGFKPAEEFLWSERLLQAQGRVVELEGQIEKLADQLRGYRATISNEEGRSSLVPQPPPADLASLAGTGSGDRDPVSIEVGEVRLPRPDGVGQPGANGDGQPPRRTMPYQLLAPPAGRADDAAPSNGTGNSPDTTI